MFTICYLGKRINEKNILGEEEKRIIFSPEYVYVEQKSVKYNEYYQAMMNGQRPELLISMNKFEFYDFFESSVEQFARVLNPITNKLIDYTILRTYEKDDDTIELTLTRGIDNVGA